MKNIFNNKEIRQRAFIYTLSVSGILMLFFIFVKWKHPEPSKALVLDLLEINTTEMLPDDPPVIEKNIEEVKQEEAEEAKKQEEGEEGKRGEAGAVDEQDATNTRRENVNSSNDGKNDANNELPEEDDNKTAPEKARKNEIPNVNKTGNPSRANPNPPTTTRNINTNNNNLNNNKPKPEPPPPPPPKPKFVMPGGTGSGTKPGQGKGGDDFNKGTGSGTVSKGTGSGAGKSGTGSGAVTINSGLRGRGFIGVVSFTDQFTENAKVYVSIDVDDNGNVTSAQIAKGTTTSNATIKSIALRKARSLRFTKGIDDDNGVILFNFIVK